mgnify:CR=1 FL=1
MGEGFNYADEFKKLDNNSSLQPQPKGERKESNVSIQHTEDKVNEVTGKPTFEFSGDMAARLAGHNVHLTLSHDAGIASAMVIVEVQ